MSTAKTQRNNRLRAKYKALGLCSKCGQRVPSAGYLQCVACREYGRKYNYGLTLTQTNEKLANQNYNCLICGKSLVGVKRGIDHNHETGQVRDILCARCNLGLAFIENTEFLKTAMGYLKRWSSYSPTSDGIS